MANILIIDDEEYIRDILSARVQGLNHTAFSAATLGQGIKLLKKEIQQTQSNFRIFTVFVKPEIGFAGKGPDFRQQILRFLPLATQ